MSTISSIFKHTRPQPPATRAYMFPGQGSQRPGMGEEVFHRHPELLARAEAVLGYSVREVCLEQPADRLRLTQYTQPALFVLCTMLYHDEVQRSGHRGDFLAGHSLGEFTALHAADVFDFETGLEMVRIRGEISAMENPGAMAAVLGLHWQGVEDVLRRAGYDQIFVANYNSPHQLVLTGAADQIEAARPTFEAEPGCKYIQLPIRGAFHSSFLAEAAATFLQRIRDFSFHPPRVPVISNATARPFPADQPETYAALLARQLTQPVRWMESVQYLRAEGVTEFCEAGPGDVLGKLNGFIMQELPAPRVAPPEPPALPAATARPLGSSRFRELYGCRYAYAVGGLEPDLTPLEAAVATARAGVLCFFSPPEGSAEELDAQLARVARAASPGLPLGVSLSQMRHPDLDPLLEAAMRHGLGNLELRDPVRCTPGMARFRLAGGRLLVRTGRLDVAEEFLGPFSSTLLASLPGVSATDRAHLATLSPASDLVVRVDYTEPIDALCSPGLLPLLQDLRERLLQAGSLRQAPCLGLGESLGTPRAIAGAFRQGADFVMTVGINGCSRTTRLSPRAKDLLQAAGPQDFVFAPDGLDFDLGLRRPVLARGVLFPRRAQYLFELSRSALEMEQLDARTREVLETRLLKQPADELLAPGTDPAERAPSLSRLARLYLERSRDAAIHGHADWTSDFSIPGDSGLGAWNRHARGTALEAWQARTPEGIAQHLMESAGELLETLPA